MRPIATLMILVTACNHSNGPHVNLTAPLPQASIEERRFAFTRIKTDGRGIQTYDPFTFNGGSGPRDYIQLADGTKVWNTEDLLAVVRPDTDTGRAVREVEHARSKERTGVLAILGGAVLGGGMIAGGIVLLSRKEASADPSIPSNSSANFGGLLLSTGGLIAVLGGLLYGMHAISKAGLQIDAANKAAFERYDESLAASMRICVRGIELVDCDAR